MQTAAHTRQPIETAVEDPAGAGLAARVALPKFGIEVGPFRHLREERERLAALTWEHFETRPLGATIGGEISGLELRPDLPDAVIAEIRQALLDYKVLVIRDQSLDTDAHVGFASRFGELEVHPFLPSNEKRPELVRFEKSRQVGGYENGWHSDVSWRECPSMGAILHAVEVPPSGGDTLFCDMYTAYDALDAETKALIDGRFAIHDYVQVFGHGVPAEQQAEMRERFPTVRHPIVRTHPETGRKLLYVNRFFVSHIEGMGEAESLDLLNRLCRQADTIEFQFRHNWRNGDVVFWDNRAVQHYATSDYWPATRIMERASIVGDRPV